MPLDTKERTGAPVRALVLLLVVPRCRGKQKRRVAGWVARTRPLAEPLSPRGPQPVLQRLRTALNGLNGSPEPLGGVPGL